MRLPVASRYVLGLYLRQMAVIVGACLAIILSIDLAGHFDGLLSGPAPASGALRYLVWRAAYNLPGVLPVAAALAVLRAELGLARRNERAMLAGAGLSGWAALRVALLFGLLIGALQFSSLAYARPAAVQALAEAGWRDYGQRFKGGVSPPRWIVLPGAVLRGSVSYLAPPELGPELLDVTLFRLTPQNLLQSVLRSMTATPAADGRALWLDQPGQWPPLDVPRLDGAGPMPDRLAVPVALSPVWLDYFDVDPQLLPQSVLAVLADDQTAGVPAPLRYRAGWQARWAAFGHLASLTMLVAALAAVMLRPVGRILPPLLIGFAGYFSHALINAFATMGEFGRLPPVAAAWAMPGVIMGCAVLALLAGQGGARR